MRAENDWRAFGPAEDLVEQRELDLTESGAAQMRAEVGRPQAALLDDLLQRRDQRLAHRVIQVVRLLDDQIDRLAFGTDELDRPRRAAPPTRGSVEKSHAIANYRPSVNVSLTAAAAVPRPRRWRGSAPGCGSPVPVPRRVPTRRCSPAAPAWSTAHQAAAIRRWHGQVQAPVDRGCSGSTSSLTKPRRSASAAVTVRPVIIQSAATLVPTIRGRW